MEIHEGSVQELAQYAEISIAFDVETVLVVSLREAGMGGFELHEQAVAVPYKKDYDTESGSHPTDWPRYFDLSRWGLLVASEQGQRVGGALIAFNTPGVTMLEDRSDLAVLWDIRVAPEVRGRGVGSALFGAAARWAMKRSCTTLKVETQNVNVPACHFYNRQGCTLGGINRFVYPELPEEVQLLWYRDLKRR